MANKNNKKANETKVTTNNSIIEVAVNGLTTIEVVADVNSRLDMVEKSVFNIALECAYALGKTIPQHTDVFGVEHASATCEKPFAKQADLLKHINRSKQTLSRWITAMNKVLEKGYFHLFANGTLPFSYDKIILICDNEEVFEKYVFADLMAFSVSQLEELVKKNKKSEESEDVEESKEEDTEEGNTSEEDNATVSGVTLDEEEMALVTYNGNDYSVPRIAFEKWLSENGIVNVTK